MAASAQPQEPRVQAAQCSLLPKIILRKSYEKLAITTLLSQVKLTMKSREGYKTLQSVLKILGKS